MSISTIGGVLLTLLLGLVWASPMRSLLARGGLARANFCQREIPVALGFLLPLAVTPATVLSLLIAPSDPTSIFLPAQFVLLNGMALLGLLDDSAGEHSERGLMGHLRALGRHELTTGGVKAIYGFVVSLLTALLLPEKGFVSTVLASLVIALGANAVNLFDLRPGRALKVFFLSYMAIALMARSTGGPLLFVAAAALALAPADFRGEAMMGDTGSNVLGAMLGFFVITHLDQSRSLLVLAVLVLLHVYAEHRSLSRLIEAVPLLEWLDSLGRPKQL